MKWINDTLGHEEGDRALMEAVAVLKGVFRSSDIVARMGGDEFAVLAIDTTDINPEIITARLQNLIDTHNRRENRKHTLSISVGSSFYDPENPRSIDELMAEADRSMYEHKRSKKSHDRPGFPILSEYGGEEERRKVEGMEKQC
jgi:diguanylate cyclase (GGDEF)-like protein